MHQSIRPFGAMDQVDQQLQFSHEFSDKMEFRSHAEKFKCFRVYDENGKVTNKNKYVEEYV